MPNRISAIAWSGLGYARDGMRVGSRVDRFREWRFGECSRTIESRSLARLSGVELGSDPGLARGDGSVSPSPADVAIVPWIIPPPSFGNGTALVRKCFHAGAKCCFNRIDHHSGRSIACRTAQMPFRAVSFPSEHSLRGRMTFGAIPRTPKRLRLVLPTAIILVTDWSRTK